MSNTRAVPVNLTATQQTLIEQSLKASQDAEQEYKRADKHLKELCYMAAGDGFRLTNGADGELVLLAQEILPEEEETPSEESPSED